MTKQEDDAPNTNTRSSSQNVEVLKHNTGAEDRYRNLVDHAPDGIVIIDPETGLFTQEANPRTEILFGLSRDELLGKLGPTDLSPTYQPDGSLSAESVIGYVKAALAGEIQRFEWVHLNAKGEEFPCEITLVPFPHPTRALIRASVIDLTEQKKAEQARLALESQLAHSTRLEMIGQMTGGVAHDFNNVLSALLGNLELLERRAQDAETAAIIQSAIAATEQGAGLTRAMLNYARQAPLKPETFKLSDVVQKMESLISRTIPTHITLDTDLVDEKWVINADPSNTESAILNLVLNACDATANDGHIRIAINSVSVAEGENIGSLMPGSYIVLTVQDNGEGIPEELIDKIDAPFFTTKGVGQNSGLGLSMVQGFMSQSGGNLCIESTVGIGTTIKLYFPAAAYPHGSQALVSESNIPGQSITDLRTGCILLVEDNHSVRELIALTLKRQGYEVLTAFSTESALQAFEQAESIDLLITDIGIPGNMQGPQLAKALKESCSDLKVIFISGYAFGLETHQAGLVESDTLLTKPFKQASIVSAVEEALSTA